MLLPIPTGRLLGIALLGIPVIGITGSHPAALFVALLWLAAVSALAAVDTWFAPRTPDLAWTREHESKLSLGAWNPVTLRLRNTSRRVVSFQVRDAAPAELQPRGDEHAGMCAAGSQWTAVYRVFPIQRGDYTFGAIAVRYLGPLGLVWRQHRVENADGVSVYPNLAAIRQYEGLVRRGQLQEIGLRSSRRWGAGTEFERLRDYSPDDEYRRINWKATARRHTPIVVDYRTERSQNVIIALDAGRLMSTRLPLRGDPSPDRALLGRTDAPDDLLQSQELTRLDFSVNAALLLAYVSQEYGDRVGLLAFSDRVTRYLPPRSGRRQFLAMTEALYNLKPEPAEADYAEALGYLATRSARRSLVVLFTDIADADSAAVLIANLSHLAHRHLPLTVTLRDPEVERLASAPITGSASVYERAVASALLSDRQETLLRLKQHGVLTLDTPADSLSPSLINRYLQVKARTAL